MWSKLSQILLISAVVLLLAPWATEPAYSSQRDSGVAPGSKSAHGSSRYSHQPSTSDDESAHYSTPRSREIESLEQQCLDEVNRVRRARRLAKLDFYDDLLPVARRYSRRMAEERFFSHTDPDGRTVRERVDEAEIRWRMVGENLAYSNGYINPVAASLHSWMESPGHRRNILDPDFRLTAIGAWIDSDGTVYFTEIFLKQ